jgi:hypothetical protein
MLQIASARERKFGYPIYPLAGPLVPSLVQKDSGINSAGGSVKSRWWRASLFGYGHRLGSGGHVLPLNNGELKIGFADYQRPVNQAEDFLGYSLIGATVAVGVVLAIVFGAF